MNLAQIAQVIAARWRSALLVFVAVLVLVGGVSAMLTRKYTATSAVVLDVKSPDPIVGVVLPGMAMSSYMGTQVEVLQSERVLLKALHALGMADDPALRAQWQARTGGAGSLPAWLAEDMARRLDVRPGRDSNVVQVAYTAEDAASAAAVANAVVKAYIETTLELRTEPARQFSQLFDESARSLRESLEAAQARLSAFQQESGIAVSDERLDVENTRLAELSSQMVALQAGLKDARSRQDEARSRGDQMQEVVTNPAVMALTTALATQEARLQELGERYGDRHPQVLEQRASVEELRRRLGAERRRVAGSLGVNAAVSEARMGELREMLAAQRARVLQIKGQRDEALVLQRDVENAQRAFDSGFNRKSQSALESQATLTNVAVIRVATPPPLPSSPRLRLNLAAGALAGLALGLLTALLRERGDARVRRDEDVSEWLQMPLIGVMPNRPSQRPAKLASRLTIERVLGTAAG